MHAILHRKNTIVQKLRENVFSAKTKREQIEQTQPKIRFCKSAERIGQRAEKGAEKYRRRMLRTAAQIRPPASRTGCGCPRTENDSCSNDCQSQQNTIAKKQNWRFRWANNWRFSSDEESIKRIRFRVGIGKWTISRWKTMMRMRGLWLLVCV